jgi:hypothetical protein
MDPYLGANCDYIFYVVSLIDRRKHNTSSSIIHKHRFIGNLQDGPNHSNCSWSLDGKHILYYPCRYHSTVSLCQ